MIEGDSIIVVAGVIVMLDIEFNFIKQIDVSSINDRIAFIMCCRSGLHNFDNRPTFLLAVDYYTSEDCVDLDPSQLHHIHLGDNKMGYKAWLMKCIFDEDDLFVCKDF